MAGLLFFCLVAGLAGLPGIMAGSVDAKAAVAPIISAGPNHSMALKSDGTAVWSWGNNLHGQLGDGTIVDRHTPVQASGLSGVISISAGVYIAAILMLAMPSLSCAI